MSLLCKSEVKKFVLDFASRERHHKFTRVSAECYPYLESKLRDAIRQLVAGQPSSGVTIKP